VLIIDEHVHHLLDSVFISQARLFCVLFMCWRMCMCKFCHSLLQGIVIRRHCSDR